jgi:hypothetical protein
VVQVFWKNDLRIDRLNYGVITLIPKIKDAVKIQQYRPICLLNASYKIITKVLMLRVEECLGRIISKNQNAFIKGRNIMEGVLSLHEILHDTKRKKKDGIILKLDFEKAYDKINWDFLFEVIKQRGFCDRWCNWIKAVVASGTFVLRSITVWEATLKVGRGSGREILCPLYFSIWLLTA